MQEVLPGEASQPAEGQEQDALPGLRLTPTRLALPLTLLIAGLSGALLSLSLPPADLGWIAFLAPAPLLWLVRTARPRQGLLLGFVFGITYFGAVLYWILLFGELGWTALVVASAAYVAVFGLLAPALWRPAHPVWSSLGLAALWTILEWARERWPLGGFSWGQLGSSQVGDAALLRLASVAGVWGLSFVVILVAALLLLAIERVRRRPPVAAAYVGACLVLVLAPGLIPVLAPDGRSVDIAAIQVDVRRAASQDPVQEDRAVTMMNARLHETLRTDPPDLAIWGEGALDPGSMTDPVTLAGVEDAIASVGAPTLAGAVTVDPGGDQRTEVLVFDGRGRIVDRYAKVHLVPFGEYVPWRRSLDWISAIDQIPVDRVPGERIHTLRAPGLPPFGAPICYENSFPELERTFVRRGASFLVLTTNNASYDMTAASRQHLLMTRLRAVETGRWIAHAAVSGISAVVDPWGRVVAERGLFVPGITRATMQASGRETLYVRLGDWVPLLSLVLVLGVFLLPRDRRAAGAPPSPLPERPRALVVLPTYNERETIGSVLTGLLTLPHGVEILVVDDASPDGTAGVVRTLASTEPRVHLLEREGKGGLASAYVDGFRFALAQGCDLVVEMDSDLSHLPEELPRLLDAAASHDLVIGSRYIRGGSVGNWSRARVALSRGGNTYTRLMLGLPVHDATSGFRVYRRALIEEIVRRPPTSGGYGFQIELAYRAWLAGHDVAEVPITFREREHGHSKISRRIVVEALWLVTVWGIRARLHPSGLVSP